MKSDPVPIFFQSEAFALKMMNSPQVDIDAGAAFDPQPQVKVLNAAGLPIASNYLIVIFYRQDCHSYIMA